MLAIHGAQCGPKPCVHNVKTIFVEYYVGNPWSSMWAKTLRTQRKSQFVLDIVLAIDGARCGRKHCVHNVKTMFSELQVSNRWDRMWAKTLRTQCKKPINGVLC